MPIYLYWGEDDFAMNHAITTLKQDNLDSNWISFNFDKLTGDKEDSILSALMQVMTPPFATGDRLVWLCETNIFQNCSEELFTQLQGIIPQIPESTHFLLTSSKKPDARIKSTKLINKYAKVVEYSLISPWQTEILIKKVEEVAKEKQIKLTSSAAKILANCVGNDSRLLWQELEKLSIYQGENQQPIEEESVKKLVNVSTQNSLQLAQVILNKNIAYALELVNDLITLNEPALRILATLVGQFRTWAMVKIIIESGEKDDKKIAEFAEISNPKRIYFLKQEIKNISGKQLLSSLPILLELETSLKLGAEPLNALETTIIKLCNV